MGQALLTLLATGSLAWLVTLVIKGVLLSPSARMAKLEIERAKVGNETRHNAEVQRVRDAERAEKLADQAHRVTKAMSQDTLFRDCPWCGEQRHHPFQFVGDGKPGRVRWMLETAENITDPQAWARQMLMPYEQVAHPLFDKQVWAVRQSWQGVFPVVRTCASCGSEWGQIKL